MDANLEKVYNKSLDVWGFPQEYKGIKFHPIKIKDIEAQENFYQLFQYPKNNIPDKNILKMSYLKFLLFVVDSNVEFNVLDKLEDFLYYCTKIEHINFNIIPNTTLADEFLNKSTIEIIIGNVKFTEQDFEIIRGIILEQNGLSIEYVESFDPKLEDLLRFSNREFKDITLEDQILTFASLNNLSINDIENYTLYQFNKHFARLTLLLDYEIYSPLEVSGQIKAKDGSKLIQHYMKHTREKGRYDSILIPKEKLFTSVPGIQDEKGNIPVPLPDGFK